MDHTPEDIISFGSMIMFGCTQNWGGLWTLRETDGLFYNQYRNPNLQHVLKCVRKRFLNSEEPPYPCLWDSEDADTIMALPFGNGNPNPPGLVPLHQWLNPLRGAISVGGVLGKMAHKMGLPHLYLISAFLHDTPIPFQRYTVGSAFEREYRFGDGPDGRLIKIARDLRWTPKFGQEAKRESRS